MNEITLIILFLLAFNFTRYSYAEDISVPPLNIRVLSSVSCNYCQKLKKSLLDEGVLKSKIKDTYFTGQLPIVVRDIHLTVPIEFIEIDSTHFHEIKFTIPFEEPQEAYVPYLQTYLGSFLRSSLVSSDILALLTEELNIDFYNLSEAKKLELTIGTLEEAILDINSIKQNIPLSQAFKSPKRLIVNKSNNFYSLKQICEDSSKNNPNKKLALVVLKTHLCDTGTLVCLKSASLISDPANKFIQDNFSVYETRFIRQGELILNTGEQEVRTEFGKLDSNPQYYVIDVKTCTQLSSVYAYKAGEGIFSMDQGNRIDFNKNYVALRELLLREPKVAKLVGQNYIQKDESQIDKELKYAAEYHKKNAQLNLYQVRIRMDEIDAQLNLMQTDKIPKGYPAILNSNKPLKN